MFSTRTALFLLLIPYFFGQKLFQPKLKPYGFNNSALDEVLTYSIIRKYSTQPECEYFLDQKKLLDQYPIVIMESMNVYKYDSRLNYLRCKCYLALNLPRLAIKFAVESLSEQYMQTYSMQLYECLADSSIAINMVIRGLFYLDFLNYFGYGHRNNIQLEFLNSHAGLLLPTVSQKSLQFLSNEKYSIQRILASEMNGDKSLFGLYSYMRGAESFGSLKNGHELFIRQLENTLTTTIHGYPPDNHKHVCTDSVMQHYLHPYSGDSKLPGSWSLNSWPSLHPVKIYFCSDFLPVFSETCQGLSDALSMLNIPNKIVTQISHRDQSVYIIPFLCPRALYKPLFPILWNFEKNPRSATPTVKGGFITVEGDVTHTVYPSEYVSMSEFVWESAVSQVSAWSGIFTNYSLLQHQAFYVPPFVPNSNIHKTCSALTATGHSRGNAQSLHHNVTLFVT